MSNQDDNNIIEPLDKRKEVINKVLTLILTEMQEEGKGNLTALFTIGILEEAIKTVQYRALMNPIKNIIP